MADRYWVGGAGTWNTSNTANWSATSGGSSGASVPTSTDNAFFDGNSGAGAVTISGSNPAANVTCTGFTGSFTGTGSFSVYGNLLLASGMTTSGSFDVYMFGSGTGTYTVTTAGKTIPGDFYVNASGKTISLQDALTCTGTTSGIQVSNGSFISNGYTITAKKLQTTVSATSFNINSSAIYLNDTTTTTATILVVQSATFVGSSANFYVSGPASGSGTKSLNFAGSTINNIEFLDCAGTATHQIIGAVTANQIKSSHTKAYYIRISDGLTVSVADWQCSGNSGGQLTLTNVSSGSAATLLKTGGGTVTVTNANISWITASPSSTWTAVNSTDSGNNTGWTFTTTNSGSMLVFF